MAGGIGHGGLVQISGVPVAEGAAAGGELDASQARGGGAGGEARRFGVGGALQALEDGGVLGIRRQQARAGSLQLRQHHRAGGDQGFLVGQGQILAGADRRQGGQQAGAADDAGHHQIGAGPGGGGAEAIGAAQQFGQARRAGGRLQGLQPLAQLGNAIGIGQGNGFGRVAADLLDQQIEVVAGRECHHPEAIGKLLDDLQGLGADRAGGAEHGEGFHG